jgi:hypothetical protein
LPPCDRCSRSASKRTKKPQGVPRLSDEHLPGVPTTLTPTEFAGPGDWVSCEHRPSPNTPAARRLRLLKITRLIRRGSSSFRPVGSSPGLLLPSCLAAATGIRLFRREPPNLTGGTFTHEFMHPSRAAAGCLILGHATGASVAQAKPMLDAWETHGSLTGHSYL